MLEMLYPFSLKYVRRSTVQTPARTFRGPLSLHSTLDWHVNAMSTQTMNNHDDYAGLLQRYPRLLEQPCALYAADISPIVEQQPVWDMEDEWTPEQDAGNQSRDEHAGYNDHGTPSAPVDAQWRMEQLAFYASAHASRYKRQYGIHMTESGIAHMTRQVHDRCPGQPLEAVLLASVYTLFAHEVCHAWIEDLVSLYDFSIGEQRARYERRYMQPHQRYHGYIFMEEALCNTAAHGWLYRFLLGGNHTNHTVSARWPGFDGTVLFDAIADWMRHQPRGYRDYLPIREIPQEHDKFLANLWRLLYQIYQCQSTPTDNRHDDILCGYFCWMRVHHGGNYARLFPSVRSCADWHKTQGHGPGCIMETMETFFDAPEQHLWTGYPIHYITATVP
jgi:hypothetical protein